MPFRIGKKNIFYVGEEGSGVKLRNSEIPQNFTLIRNECLKLQKKFEDPEFPTLPESIGYIDVVKNRDIKIEEVVWRRPNEIVQGNFKPHLILQNDIRDGGRITRFDVNQGTLCDCWFLVAVENITLEPKLVEFIIPKDNSFADGEYCGAFHFRFWQKGVWLDVVIDDRLPCVWNSTESKYEVIFLKCPDNEFWPALLEKAYAKLMGSYKILEKGLPNEAMEDFTGGIWEVFSLKKDEIKKNLFETLVETHERGSFLAAGTGPDKDLTNTGLLRSHAYSITAVEHVTYRKEQVELLRLRNPYGDSREWHGAWGDQSKQWEEIPAERRKELSLTFRVDGEFWMEFKDFKKYFDYIHACHLSPEALDSNMNDKKWKKWHCEGYFGSWTRDKFAPESQHFVTVGHYHDDKHRGPPQGTLIVALMNKKIPLSGKAISPEFGFEVYRVEDQKPTLKPSFFRDAQMEGRETTKVGHREVVHRFHLDPATYCIIPYCVSPDYQGEYLLRVVAEKQKLVDSDYSYKKSWNCSVA